MKVSNLLAKNGINIMLPENVNMSIDSRNTQDHDWIIDVRASDNISDNHEYAAEVALIGDVMTPYSGIFVNSASENVISSMVKETIIFESETKSALRLDNQMVKRGWTKAEVENTVSNPYTTRASKNMATGNTATAYYNSSGAYVIVDDVTRIVVQVSDNINPSIWIPDPNIINPYILNN